MQSGQLHRSGSAVPGPPVTPSSVRAVPTLTVATSKLCAEAAPPANIATQTARRIVPPSAGLPRVVADHRLRVLDLSRANHLAHLARSEPSGLDPLVVH